MIGGRRRWTGSVSAIRNGFRFRNGELRGGDASARNQDGIVDVEAEAGDFERDGESAGRVLEDESRRAGSDNDAFEANRCIEWDGLKLLNRGMVQAGVRLHQHSAGDDRTKCRNQNGGRCLVGPTTLHLKMIGARPRDRYTTFGGFGSPRWQRSVPDGSGCHFPPVAL